MWETIIKPETLRATAELTSGVRAAFSWEKIEKELLDGLPGGAINIAYEAVDRHVAHGFGSVTALRWLGKSGERLDLSYADLSVASARFASVLASHGLGRGDRVFSLLGRQPEVFHAALGTLKAGMTFTPLFSAFGPEPIRTRMEIGQANALVTTEAIYRRKIEPWIRDIPSMRLVLIVGETAPEGCVALDPAMQEASPGFEAVPTRPEDEALIHFTSGTTGRPKGAVHVHHAVLNHAATGRYALELRPGAIYWCTADPGWVTGTSYGIIAPLVHRATLIIDEAEFDLERWYATIEREKVEVWYTAPTAIRMMMRAGKEAAARYDFSSLRFLASVGEPLNPEAVVWGSETFGLPFHDNWWQTETGGIMIANTLDMDIKPGSMGRPLPGIEAEILNREDGGIRPCKPGEIGDLALKAGWPSMMRAYLHEEARYKKCFVDDWYISGDLALKDEDGYFWFVGRADDLIKSSGHLIGPFEVESALIEHEAVAEAGVIGLPDETAGEVVKAYVSLNPGYEPSDELEKSIRGHARKKLGPAVAPRTVEFRKTLPKTRSGKIMRRLLKARELGLPEGDISTLETDES
ncbi:MAG: acetate--CoA ligase [Hoeflea sp.]|uniref:acetate--CoA ligase n=1 Tax=Hoeflea sp. TaxID=1940281 RepID=UPI001DCE7E37|nr:acetate--CoA ligase [Hoeflea sp.]MBU4529571.1 acetate--CoA ligase [Alphaproteobacteria bacterium]MBU4546690.1 acetate--CoA ligase [Alphaproteobacteria bacterium]MBU4550958.1 acetate--CoA ligase [Alphaproteobacteria bacterium]MBV1723900.1 acetate--CoA ligase [Hoeflea sp.]MBV1763177.1 acetate--CoA ligase [Hoeflea sp.]